MGVDSAIWMVMMVMVRVMTRFGCGGVCKLMCRYSVRSVYMMMVMTTIDISHA